ncbi:hypothetical protein [Streptomyces youssoufiensis]
MHDKAAPLNVDGSGLRRQRQAIDILGRHADGPKIAEHSTLMAMTHDALPSPCSSAAVATRYPVSHGAPPDET